MEVAFALDISTSIIGWSIVDASFNNVISLSLPIDMGFIDLRKYDGFWTKVDKAEASLQQVILNIQKLHKITFLFIEDPLERFRRGSSSAHVISLLSKFNAIISRHARSLLKFDPVYIGATTARKTIGISLLSKKKSGGIDQKLQTFNQLNLTVFKTFDWPKNKNGNIQPYCFDQVDAFVICCAGLLNAKNT